MMPFGLENTGSRVWAFSRRDRIVIVTWPMFSFWRFFHRINGATSGVVDAPSESRIPAGPVRVVVITPDARDRALLARIADQFGWTFTAVTSTASAIGALQPNAAHLVICDRDLPDEEWQDALPKLAAAPQVLGVLLASTVADDYLWDEVIKHRGFDVVVKPYDAEQLHRIVTFAQSSKRWQ